MKIWKVTLAVFLTLVLLLCPLGVAANQELESLAPGDPTGDGKVDAADALMILQRSVLLLAPEWGVGWYSEDGLRICDLDGDCKITASDALLVLQYSVSLIDSFPERDLSKYQQVIDQHRGDPWAAK